MEPAEKEQLELVGSTSSAASSLLTGEDSRSTTSSGDISTTSGSSGEIPAAILLEASAVVVVPRDAALPGVDEPPSVVVATTARRKCVGKNTRVSWGSTSVIGRRKEMEDAVAVVPGFLSRTCDHVGGCTAFGSSSSAEISPIHFFGVYDGHGGSQVAEFCKERMHRIVAEEWDREAVDGYEWQKRWEAALSIGFERIDREVSTDAVATEMVGSTAVVVVLSGCQIIASNCGDSRAVLCRGSHTIPLTVDQKPDRPDEHVRIEGGGGKVINWNGARVFGVLSMSRAIVCHPSQRFHFWYLPGTQDSGGTTRILQQQSLMSNRLFSDRYLRPWIIPVPEITFETRTDEDECLILASDGLWDVMTTEEVGELARCLLRRRLRSMQSDHDFCPAQAVADKLREIAYGRNSSDNISIIVVDLKSRRRQAGVKKQ